QLMAELAKIKAERAEAAAKVAAEQAKKDEEQREKDIALGNPLLNGNGSGGGGGEGYGVKRRWDDDVVFRNQARGTEERGKEKRFVNDLLRSDFHRRFMDNDEVYSPISGAETLNGALLVAQSIFATLLKGDQDILKKLDGSCEEKDKRIRELEAALTIETDAFKALEDRQAKTMEVIVDRMQAKDKEIKARVKDAELVAAKAQSFGPRLDVVVTQAGYPTRSFAIVKRQPLAATLGSYCEMTEQKLESLVVRTNAPLCSGQMVDPGKVVLKPLPLDIGEVQFRAYEVIRVEASAAKRKAMGGEMGGVGKKQKV
ncbi:hypothetical protein B0A55_05826, partial [Friedmanniomyces simplex]